jgi:hypothetical protein
MVKVAVGGSIDVHKIQRLVRSDEILVGYPSGIMHPASTYLRHKISSKTGRRLKGMERAGGGGGEIENADLAEKLHDGTSDIPARPWLYQGISSAMGKIRKAIKEYYEAFVADLPGANPAKIGALAVGAVQGFVRGDYYRSKIPNAPSTIAQKGSDRPLLDTGFLIDSTAYVIAEKEKRPDRRKKATVSDSGATDGFEL